MLLLSWGRYLIVFTLRQGQAGEPGRHALLKKPATPGRREPEECCVTFQVLDCVAPVAGASVAGVRVRHCASAADDLAILLCRALWKKGSLRFLKQVRI